MTADAADIAIRALAEEARRFSTYKPGRNASARYAVALSRLVDAARVFAQRSDEEWAADVVAAREEGRREKP